MTSHDRLFKALFEAFFRDLLALVDGELGALVPVDAAIEFLDKELLADPPHEEQRVVDLLAAISDRAGGWSLLVHLEIERRARGRIGERLWRYWLRLRARHPQPLVSLVVVLRGGAPGISWHELDDRAAGRAVASFRYGAFGLSKVPAATLLDRSEPLAWALAALADPRPLGRPAVKLRALDQIGRAQISERERLLLVNCVETYLPLKGPEAEEYALLARRTETPEDTAMQLTWADRIEAKGIKKGMAQGLREGRQEGRQEGREEAVARLRRTVLRQLGQRFGPLSAGVVEAVEALRTVEELSAIADRILDVRSLEELGLVR